MGDPRGGGDFVVLRASGEDDYNDYIYGLCHCDSVETIVFESREAASDPDVIEHDPQRRGDLHRRRRPVALRALLEGNAGRGRDQLRRGQARADRRHERGHGDPGRVLLFRDGRGEPDQRGRRSPTRTHADLTLARDFLDLPGLHGVLTDQHLWERDRIGRTVTLMARLLQDGWSDAGRGDRRRPRDGAAHRSARRKRRRCSPRRTIRRRTCTSCAPRGRRSAASRVSRSPSVMSRSIGSRPAAASTSPRGAAAAGIAYTLSVEDGRLRSSRGGLY